MQHTRAIGITGATGKIGGRVAELLAEARAAGEDLRLRLIVRDPSRAPQIDGAEVAAATYGDADACRAAFAGLDALLLVSAAESADRLAEHRNAIGAAVDAGVGHVVYTSFMGAGPHAEFTLARDHGATEEMLREAGLPRTILRDNFYADVLVDFAGPDRTIRGPGGEGRCAFVAREDVAQVAAAVLREPVPAGEQVLELTGPEALTLGEAAATMTEVLGEPFAYVDETLEEARASRAPYGAPDWQIDAWISTYTAIASGSLSRVSGDVESVLGRAPMTLAEVLRGRR